MEEQHKLNTDIVRDIIIGMSDGLTVPFALTEAEHYDAELKIEHKEIEEVPFIELKEVEDIFSELGVDNKLSKQVALQVSRN